MGRRKIEIKAIKDDRNRSVTFLKRKGGLFKKAHELSVLCSVDVAVIIFGNNKKLYEYSSTDINDTLSRFYNVGGNRGLCCLSAKSEGISKQLADIPKYQGPHDHKGPADFSGKGGLDEDDDDEVDDTVHEDIPPEQAMHEHSLPAHLQHQPAFQQLRQGASASPPIVNGTAPFHQRQHTPQGSGSRPISRNDVMRPQSNLGPQHQQVGHAPNMPNGYSYMPSPPMYNTHAPQHQHSGNPQYQYPHPPAPLVQVQQAYMQEQRRQSMPAMAAMTSHERHPQHHGQQIHTPPPPPPPPPQADPPARHDLLQQPRPVPSKSKSIFTPIDDSRSILAQHWGSSPQQENVKVEGDNLSPQIDVTMAPGESASESQGVSAGSLSHGTSNLARASSISSSGGDLLGAKRPKLNLQIPSEQSDDGGSATGGSTPHGSGEAGETTGKTESSGNNASGVVLPAPSPSAGAILSAGAQGPPNPFARPLPPGNHANSQAFAGNNNIETPISGLPSRFVSDGLLPSPSTFFAGWVDGNMLPSPLNFQTPVVGNGPSFGRDEDGQNKRKSPDEALVDPGGSKRVKASVKSEDF